MSIDFRSLAPNKNGTLARLKRKYIEYCAEIRTSRTLQPGWVASFNKLVCDIGALGVPVSEMVTWSEEGGLIPSKSNSDAYYRGYADPGSRDVDRTEVAVVGNHTFVDPGARDRAWGEQVALTAETLYGARIGTSHRSQ